MRALHAGYFSVSQITPVALRWTLIFICALLLVKSVAWLISGAGITRAQEVY